jgi:DNA invertase Pin-like site-specific DNA recombinase
VDSDGLGERLGSALGPVTAQHLQRLAIAYVRQSTPDQVRDNVGSTAAQRDLANVARGLGWPESRIRVIDSDLGFSGTSTTGRQGYLELLTLMEREAVGIVLVQELSRLSRKNSGIASFLELARETGTLIYTNGAVHDPASGDATATLGLDIAGTFGNWDNRVRARRMQEAKLAKAKRGQTVSPAPIGYVRTPRGDWDKDPDRAVQDAIQRAYDQYQNLGSLGKVVKYFRQHGLEFPRRRRGQVRWGPVDASLLHSMLHNPAYCGDYVFLRRQTRRRSDGTGVIVKLRPANEWIVKPHNHPAYVPREVWQRIQEMLSSRRPAVRPLVGKGPALLQSLLRCGAEGCGRWMKTHYWGREGVARSGTYTCIRQNGWGDITHKVTFPARFIDHAVVEHVLAALTAIDEDTARTIVERSQLERATLERAQCRRLLEAEEDLQRIRQLLLNFPTGLQHARNDLMAEYDSAVARHLALKTHLATEPATVLSVTTADIGDLIEQTRNIRHLWEAPRRTNDQRKQLLQAVISEIIVHRADRDGADLEIAWTGGLRQPFRVYRPRGVEALVADRTQKGKSSRAIADELNAVGAITASGQPMSPQLVAQKQGRRGLRLKAERLRARQIIRQGLIENLPRPEILNRLRAQAPRLGPWDPQRLSNHIRHLRRPISGIEPLPAVLPAEEDKQRVLALIGQALDAGKTWRAIAVLLNDAGLRPPRGTAFTPVQVRLLYMRAHRLKSFKLSPRSDSTETST